MANTVDIDETSHYELSHLDLQCLQISAIVLFALYGLIVYIVAFSVKIMPVV